MTAVFERIVQAVARRKTDLRAQYDRLIRQAQNGSLGPVGEDELGRLASELGVSDDDLRRDLTPPTRTAFLTYAGDPNPGEDAMGVETFFDGTEVPQGMIFAPSPNQSREEFAHLKELATLRRRCRYLGGNGLRDMPRPARDHAIDCDLSSVEIDVSRAIRFVRYPSQTPRDFEKLQTRLKDRLATHNQTEQRRRATKEHVFTTH